MSKKVSKRFYLLGMFFLCLVAALGGVVVAQRSVETALASNHQLGELKKVGTAFTGGKISEPAPIQLTIFRIVRILLSMVGTILLVVILYGGFLWYSAGGSTDKVADAKKTLVRAVIGMIIISTSYAIVTFFFNASAVDQSSSSVGSIASDALEGAIND